MHPGGAGEAVLRGARRGREEGPGRRGRGGRDGSPRRRRRREEEVKKVPFHRKTNRIIILYHTQRHKQTSGSVEK